MDGYWTRVAIALDQLGNTILGGNPVETISSRCARKLPACRLCHWVCRLLAVFQSDHCIRALASEAERLEETERRL